MITNLRGDLRLKLRTKWSPGQEEACLTFSRYAGRPGLGDGGRHLHLHRIRLHRHRPPVLREERVVRHSLQKHDGEISFFRILFELVINRTETTHTAAMLSVVKQCPNLLRKKIF